ncbi:MAG: uracil-DNA glycosylase [Holosporales bacterium]|jgi:uracil-DNA glycosylase family 4
MQGAVTLNPPVDCNRCPRLATFRQQNRLAFPGHHNPVPSFGGLDAALLVVGLAPGLHGANRTGRPFTGDYAGDLLYPTLLQQGFARGSYAEHADDGLVLENCRITNAVRCVPPANKPTPEEAASCRPFLVAELAAMPQLRVLLALGRVAHEAVLRTLSLRLPAYPFGHGAEHRLPNGLLLIDSYHCSRYNTNTGRLTASMFEAVMHRARQLIDEENAQCAA